MTQYMISTDKPKDTNGWYKISFETDSKVLHEEIERYILICTDAIKWREQVLEISKRV